MQSESTHRICERCWFDGPPAFQWDGGIPGVLPGGEYRMPVTMINDIEPGACCGCTGMTITGIFIYYRPDALRCGGLHEDLSWSQVAQVAKVQDGDTRKQDQA